MTTKTIVGGLRRTIDLRPRNTEVIELTETQKLLLESTSEWIQSNHQDADLVGIVWRFFDSGCMAGIGFSRESGIVTPVVRVGYDLP